MRRNTIALAIMVWSGGAAGAGAQSPAQPAAQVPPSPDAVADRQWEYGGFADAGYLFDHNHPANKVFRSRGTTWHVDALHLNMAGAYVRKKASHQSRWGTELLVQAGKDDEIFGFSATAPTLAGAEWLRHIGLANISYQTPVGKGLAVQAGIFSSLIGYDSLYAKDNINYTRPWGADFTPYLMMGINAAYPLTPQLTATFYLINGYWHLANANHVPSGGVQFVYKAAPHLTIKQTILSGPHQANTAPEFWRHLSDTIIERRSDRVVAALNFHIATEMVDSAPRTRASWLAAQMPVRWTPRPSWSFAFRPEIAWDSDGRWTLARQTVKAATSTAEYRLPYERANMLVRLEHRFDVSRGPDGGFFDGGRREPAAIALTPTQHLLIVGLILTFDRPAR